MNQTNIAQRKQHPRHEPWLMGEKKTAPTEANTEPTIIVDLEELAREVAQPMLPAQPKKRGRPEKVSKDMFTEAWNKCDSLKEVAELLGVPALSASVKASNLRKTGRDLKKYKRGAKRKQPRLTSAT
jgi:hypothetical protein